MQCKEASAATSSRARRKVDRLDAREIGWTPISASRRRQVTLAVSAALVGAVVATAPAQAAVTTPGASIEAFHGRDFIGLHGYPRETAMRVEVVAPDSTVVGFANITTGRDGSYELNHVGGSAANNDCFDGFTAPDIIPGDTIRVIHTGGTDTSVVQDVQYGDPFEQEAIAAVEDDPLTVEDESRPAVPRSLSISGWARDSTGAPLDNASIRVRGSFDTTFDHGADLERDTRIESALVLDATGNWTITYPLSDTDEYAEIGVEWGNGPLSEITVFDGIGSPCPRGAGGDRPILSPPPFVPPAPAQQPLPPTRTPVEPRIVERIVTNSVVRQVPVAGAVAGLKAGSVSPARLTLSGLSMRRVLARDAVRANGLGAVMRLKAGTKALRIRIYRKNADGTRSLVAERFQSPAAGGLYRMRLKDRSLRQTLKAGSYEAQLAPGRSRTSFGKTAKLTFRVVP